MSACEKNIALNCKVAGLVYWLGSIRGALAGQSLGADGLEAAGGSIEICQQFRAWQQCAKSRQQCDRFSARVFEGLFSANRLILANGLMEHTEAKLADGVRFKVEDQGLDLKKYLIKGAGTFLTALGLLALVFS